MESNANVLKNLMLADSDMNRTDCFYGAPSMVSSINNNNRDDDANRQLEAAFKHMDGMVLG